LASIFRTQTIAILHLNKPRQTILQRKSRTDAKSILFDRDVQVLFKSVHFSQVVSFLRENVWSIFWREKIDGWVGFIKRIITLVLVVKK
jgi:hypothetical protein